MNRTAKLILALAAPVFAGSMADAQAGEWNRNISNVRKIHPPGTAPGFHVVTATLTLGNTGAVPNVDLGVDCLLELNGVQQQVLSVPIQGRLPLCAFGSCAGTCAYSVTSGQCGNANWSSSGCACIGLLDLTFAGIQAGQGSLLRVSITPTIGAVTDLDTSDDWATLVVGENDPGTLSCPGDGTGTACPCANSGATGNGCANSSNPLGATLAATGFTETSPGTGTDSVVLHGAGMPATAPVLYLQLSSGATPIPFGDGIFCVGGTLIRLSLKINAGGTSFFPGPGDPSLSVAGGAVSGSGTTYAYQAYYRDTGSFCTSSTFNLTNGVRITW